MEYILTDIWKGQMCNAKLLKSMPGECSTIQHHQGATAKCTINLKNAVLNFMLCKLVCNLQYIYIIKYIYAFVGGSNPM